MRFVRRRRRLGCRRARRRVMLCIHTGDGANKGVARERRRRCAAAAESGTRVGSKPTAAVVLYVVLTFSEWPINFVYPPACIINARLLPRENPSGPPTRQSGPPVDRRPSDRPAGRRVHTARPPPEVALPPPTTPPCLSKSQQSPSSLKLISNNPYIINYQATPPPRLRSCSSLPTAHTFIQNIRVRVGKYMLYTCIICTARVRTGYGG